MTFFQELNIPPRLRNGLFFSAWILGLVLAGALCWSLTQQARARALLGMVNRILVQEGRHERLVEIIPRRELPPRASRMGFWFSLEGAGSPERRVLVFPLISGRGSIPCAAVLNSQGRIEELLPLCGGGKTALEEADPGAVQLYRRRIEAGFARREGP